MTSWREHMKSSKSQLKPSRKQRVRELYFEQGAEEAFTFGRRLQLQPTTLHSWIGTSGEGEGGTNAGADRQGTCCEGEPSDGDAGHAQRSASRTADDLI